MKKTLEKVALVALVCITFFFVLVCLLLCFNVLPVEYDNGIVVDSIVLVLLSLLAVVFVGLSVYLIYCAFADRSAVKEVLLYAFAESKTNAKTKVFRKIAKDNCALVDGIKIKKLLISPDDKLGFKMDVFVNVTASDVAATVDTFRNLCADSFANVLGITFSAINIHVLKVKTDYTPVAGTVESASEIAAEEKAAIAEETAKTEQTDAPAEDSKQETSVEKTAESKKKEEPAPESEGRQEETVLTAEPEVITPEKKEETEDYAEQSQVHEDVVVEISDEKADA